MKRHIRNEDGHYIVEASIIVPFVLALIIAIGSMCQIAGIKENIVHSSADEMRAAMINSYIYGTDINLGNRLEKRIIEENPSVIDTDVNGFMSGFTKAGHDELLKINVKYGVDITTPIPLNDEISEKLSFTGRKFVGKNGDGTAFGFDNMEKQEDADTVYIFPKDGQRYHKKDCTFVAPEAIQVILNEDLRKEYSQCESCDTKELANGATVYIFEAYGDSYHRKNCSTIEKNIIAIDRETAEEKGYTPCKKCGG